MRFTMNSLKGLALVTSVQEKKQWTERKRIMAGCKVFQGEYCF